MIIILEIDNVGIPKIYTYGSMWRISIPKQSCYIHKYRYSLQNIDVNGEIIQSRIRNSKILYDVLI